MSLPVLPITVIIPVFNREHTLEATLRSVEDQDGYRVAKTLVIDDSSTDGSVAVAENLGYEVVRLPENQGAAAARNVGIGLAQTAWVAFLDSDDRWRPNLLATLWPHTESHVLVSGSAYLRTGASVVSLMGAEPPGVTLRGPLDIIDPENPVMTSSTLVRADIVSRLGGFDTTWAYSEDFALWLRVLEHGPGWCDATPTIEYQRGTSSKSEHGKGVDDARVRIVYSFAQRPWWRKQSAERLVGVIYWEAIRSALRARRWSAALRYGSKVLSSRDRMIGTRECLARRRRLRRRLKELNSGEA